MLAPFFNAEFRKSLPFSNHCISNSHVARECIETRMKPSIFQRSFVSFPPLIFLRYLGAKMLSDKICGFDRQIINFFQNMFRLNHLKNIMIKLGDLFFCVLNRTPCRHTFYQGDGWARDEPWSITLKMYAMFFQNLIVEISFQINVFCEDEHFFRKIKRINLIRQLFKSFSKSKVIIIFENTNAKIYRTMGSSGKNKAVSKKMPSNQKQKRTVSPQQKMAVSSAPNSGGATKSKVIQQKLLPFGSKRQ